MLSHARIAAVAALVASPALAQPHVCGTDCVQDILGESPVTLGSRAGIAFRGGGCVEDGSRIDILIAYTPDAATAAGGVPALETLAADSIAELNTALAASGVPTTAVLVGVEPVAASSSGSGGSDLADLRDPGDGRFDEVHALRDDLNADLVSLFVGSSDVCGIAYIGVLPGAVGFEDLGFSIVLQSCATGGVHAFTHEIGHNLGLLHDFEAQPCTSGARPWARGFVAPDESFRTVMATSSAAPRELMFSSPGIDVGGQPAGVAFDDEFAADNALALLDATAVVARFRDRDRNNNGQCDADEILAGTLTDCDANGVPDAFDQDFNRNGTPDACDIALGTSLDADLDGVPDEVEVPVLFVNANAPASPETGTSWPDAMTDLQDAMALARASGDVDEIWVASGTYRTAEPGARHEFFRFADGVAVRGGFDGSESQPSQRDPAAAPTVLSGDTNGDDGPGFTNRADNALHVAYIRDYDNTVELDRLTFSGGNASDGPNCSLNHTGGGLFTLRTDVLVRDCVFEDNEAWTGAGAAIQDQTVSRIFGSDFSRNRSTNVWGSFASGPIFTTGWAPGVYLSGDKSGDENLFVNNRVTHNSTDEGVSGMFAIGGQPTIAGCVIAHNTTSYVVGYAFSVRLADGTRFVNNVVANNAAPNASATNATGFYADTDDLVVKNSIFWNNTAAGAETVQRNNFDTRSTNTGLVVDRVIIGQWDGTLPGVGSGEDPLFTDAGGGDYTLLAGSPAIDAGDNSALPADTLDLDGDADTLELLPFDIAGLDRFSDDPATPDSGLGPGPVVDLGAHERAGAPACFADCDGSGTLNIDDIDCFVAGFLGADLAAADCDGNGTLNIDDIDCFVSGFLAGCP